MRPRTATSLREGAAGARRDDLERAGRWEGARMIIQAHDEASAPLEESARKISELRATPEEIAAVAAETGVDPGELAKAGVADPVALEELLTEAAPAETPKAGWERSRMQVEGLDDGAPRDRHVDDHEGRDGGEPDPNGGDDGGD